MGESPLEPNRTDRVAAIARATVGACPYVGGLLSEVVGELIPGQREERIIHFLSELDEKVARIDTNLEIVERNLRSPEGQDLLEESASQAVRALTEQRRNRITNLLSRSLSEEEIHYAQSRKLLNLLRDLTDPELILLYFYCQTPTSGSQWHSDLMDQYPDVLRPVSRAMGSSQEEIDRGALQDSYKNTLLRLGLLEEKGERRRTEITSLGRLMIRYIEDEGQEFSEEVR